jgi:hypothetical protein
MYGQSKRFLRIIAASIQLGRKHNQNDIKFRYQWRLTLPYQIRP